MASMDDVTKAEIKALKESILESLIKPPEVGNSEFRLPFIVGGCPICHATDHETFTALGMKTLICPNIRNITGMDIVLVNKKLWEDALMGAKNVS